MLNLLHYLQIEMNNKIITSGKRKTAIAKAEIKEGTGKITINKVNYENLHKFDVLRMKEPLLIAERILGKANFDVAISVHGGIGVAHGQRVGASFNGRGGKRDGWAIGWKFNPQLSSWNMRAHFFDQLRK